MAKLRHVKWYAAVNAFGEVAKYRIRRYRTKGETKIKKVQK